MSEDNFWTDERVKQFHHEYSHTDANLDKLINQFKASKKPKPVLFTTTDGIDIREGDSFWMVFTAPNGIGNPSETKARQEMLPFKCYQKTFSTKEAANEWIVMNNPCISIKEILEKSIMCGSNGATIIHHDLREIVKSKLNVE